MNADYTRDRALQRCEVHSHGDHSHGDELHSHGSETHSHVDESHLHGGETHSHADHTHGGESHSHGGETHSHGGGVHSDAIPLEARTAAALSPSVEGRVLYVDCFAGASGDMLLGALVDVGLPLEELKAALAKLDLAGYEVVANRVLSHGLTGTRLHVGDARRPAAGAGAEAHGHARAHEGALSTDMSAPTIEQPARRVHDIRRIIQSSALSDSVKTRSMAVIEGLGRAEAGIHGVSLDEVHFHEIGAVDTIVDVVGFVVGLELLGVERVYASPIPLGSGTIQTAHGRLPAPAPATLALLASAGAPTVPHPAQTEIVTPTGAALLSQLATFERPPMRVLGVGYGFGQKEFPWANGLRVWLGELDRGQRSKHAHGTSRRSGASERSEAGRSEEHRRWESDVIVFECNLDDTTGETLGYTMERLLDAGALDVWFTSIQMKKNRPGVLLSVLSPADASTVETLTEIVMRETSTLGVRTFPPVHRFKADRRMREVETPWGSVQVKEKWLGDQWLAASPEYEDCARLARESGEPIVRIMNAARDRAESERNE